MTRKLLAVFGAIVLLGTMVVPGVARVNQPVSAASPVAAAPTSAVDESKVPHYFGPYPNWANSPLTSPDATVTITGDGTGATATATVGANGAVTGITITDPGSGYTTASVNITGAGNGATADAFVTASSAVTAVNITAGGAGYTAPKVTFSGGGGVTSTTTVGNAMVDRAYATDYVAPPAVVLAVVTQIASQTFFLTVGNATGGTFSLTVDGTASAPIAFDASAASIEAAITGATVTGASPWTIVFAVAPASVAIDSTGLTIGVSDATAAVGATPDVWNVSVGSASNGDFTLDIDGTLTAAIAWNAPALDVENALSAVSAATVTGTGSTVDRWVITFAAAPTAVTPAFAGLTQAAAGFAATAAGTYSASIGTAISGTFTLTVDGTTTVPLAFDAAAATIEAALTGATVTGAGPWTIVFAAAPTTVLINGSVLTQPAVPLVPVFVVVPTALPAGTLTSFQSWNQATPGGALVASAGQKFHAYVLRHTGVANEYQVISDSGELTVPELFGGPSALATYPVGNIPVQASDVLGFYGAGMPVDTGAGVDRFSYPAPVAPAQGATITFGSLEFPDFGQARTYSFGASVTTIAGPVQATGTVYGGVDAVTVDVQGSGYRFPTVDFDLPDDPNGVQAQGHAVCADPYPTCDLTVETDFLTVTGVVVDSAGSGYATAPAVVIRDGTQFDPINHGTDPFTEATATATLVIQSVVMDTFGSGYTSAPDVAFSDTGAGTGSGANGTATTAVGSVTAVNLTAGGSGYITPDGIQKFVDTLPGLGAGAANNLGQYIPVAEPDTTTFSGADYYVIGVMQHRERMSSSLPAEGTMLRTYVQLSTSVVSGAEVLLVQDNLDGSTSPVMMPDGITRAVGVTEPHYLGPTIVASKDRAVRIVFYNLLPKDAAGDLFLPTDSSMMGSGMGPDGSMPEPVDAGTVTDAVRNPMCSEYPKDRSCFKDNRATLHLHGGVTPWISDGTPHQWITPAGENTMWPQGVSVQNVPDMVGTGIPDGVPDCSATNDGCQTFYYTNQQSARLMFYHDHAWGITRLNVYAGEAAGYVLTDPTEQKLFGPSGTYADMGEGIPLVIQDKTFVPTDAQLAGEDPTWDASRWGGYGNLWYHHVYMPAQNPGDPGGMSAYGRWMYGPWFWPPATPQHGPIANPYYGKDPATNFTTDLAVPCDLDTPSTWQYQVEPFCEPPEIPGTPNISAGMEQFNDTPLVNGTVYPTTTLEPKSYRFRVLNAANDRFWNLSWYVADPTTASTALNGLGQVIGGTEVALKADEVAAALTDPNIVPQPDTSKSPAGPDWVQFGSEGGFLPAPTVVPAQPTTWITDPTRFDVGNVDKHSLLLAPAERGDVIVDFSKFAGKTLILYNDAPAAFPARVPGYDYYSGASDGLTLPGYGPNTRTVMQVKIAANPPATAFNVTSFKNLFTHKANGSGVFEASQDPIIVGQAGYNSAYGKNFAASGDCTNPAGTNKCDGMARINQQGGDLFRFDTLKASNPQLKVKIEPKAIHDEMNSAAFDEFGRMTANLGLEAVPATPAGQNILLYPYIAPPTEVIDGTNLPKGDVNIQPISSGSDGTQIWKITHNGVDTHPIHFHLFNVQVLNRVTWDNIIIPTEPSELGWKETVRISPLEDTIVALRPITPTLPFEVPNSIRLLSPMMPLGADLDPNGLIVDPAGNVTTVTNALVNFGWEYVYHCHILSHEEMDMMRPVLYALPPKASVKPTFVVTGTGNNTRLTLTWVDNSITETSFLVQRQSNNTGAWTTLSTVTRSLAAANTTGEVLTYADTTFRWNSTLYSYRVIARNTVGAPAPYAGINADAASPTVFALRAPTNLTATLQANPAGGVQVGLGFTDNLAVETGFAIERSIDGVTFSSIATAPARAGTGAVTFVDTTVTYGTTYSYRVADITPFGNSPYTNTAQVIVPAQPLAPTALTAANGANQGSQRRVVLTWGDNANNETGFTVQRATDAAFTTGVANTAVAANATTTTISGLTRNTNYYFRIRANNGTVVSSGWVTATPLPIHTIL